VTSQVETQIAFHEHYRTSVLLSAMDLSVEAEAFGCEIIGSDNEIPTVTGRLVTNQKAADVLAVPEFGAGRTAIGPEVVRQLRERYPERPVLGGCIGPFSLATRLAGVSETLLLTRTEPQLVTTLLKKSNEFLIRCVLAFLENGADGVLMAEPAAGLLSPRGMLTFSSEYIAQIREAIEAVRPEFALIVHNCAAKTAHLEAMLATGCRHFHFGTPMDMRVAFERVPESVMLYGNLDPSAIFCLASAEDVAQKTRELLEMTRPYPNFVVSSGCDLPPETNPANLDAFFGCFDVE
jgi:Uroporphyrinogen-III decarboxylase